MLADIMSGKINCVVVKDLSRLARNYSDAGSLIDNLFVQMGVRFISLAENVDSYLDPDSVSDIKVPITNVMNDNYCFRPLKKSGRCLITNGSADNTSVLSLPLGISKTRRISTISSSTLTLPKWSSWCFPCSCRITPNGRLRFT